MLKESLWPGGQLRSGDGCPQTDQQKAAKKQEALRLLKNFLPGLLLAQNGNFWMWNSGLVL
jgi:hypothetical protein